MHAMLHVYEKQREWYARTDPMSVFRQYARAIGLDIARFTADVQRSEFQRKLEVRRQKRVGSAYGARQPSS